MGAGRSHDPHAGLVFVRGCGDTLWDIDGKAYLDLICGYSAVNLGHAHPRLLAAARTQLSQLAFCTGASHPWRSELEEKVAQLVDGPSLESNETKSKVWLSSTGSRAVEIAWKIAFANRPGKIMRFHLSYHGRSLATAHISDTGSSDALRHQVGVKASMEGQDLHCVIPFPMCGRQCDGKCEDCDASIDVARHWLDCHSEDTSAMILEPAIGARGYHFASGAYFRRLVKLLRSYGVQVISDEIQMGLGRLGSMIASIDDGWKPDFVVLGKSLGGGITPISAVIGDRDRMDKLPQGFESETFAANPLACRVALEAISVLNDESLMASVSSRGNLFRETLRGAISAGCRVDGRGFATVIDLSGLSNQGARSDDASRIAWDWVCHAQGQGLLVHLTGVERNRIAIIPPLNMEDAALQQAIEILSSFWKVK